MSSTRTTKLYSTSFIQLSSYRFSTQRYFYSVLLNYHAAGNSRTNYYGCQQQLEYTPHTPNYSSLFKISPGHVTKRQTKQTIQMATWQFKRNKERKKPVLITESWCPNKQKLPLQQLVSIFQRTVLAISFEEEHCCPVQSRYLSHVDIEYNNAACVMLLLYISQYTFHFLLPIFSDK